MAGLESAKAAANARRRYGASRGALLKSPARKAAGETVPVILVGPPGLYGEGLQQVLKSHDFAIVAGSSTLEAVDPARAGEAQIVIVMDPSGEPNLPRTVATLQERNPRLRFVLLVDTSDSGRIAAALQVPAHAFLCQKIACEPLLKALDVVLGDGAVMSLDLMPYLLAHPREEAEPVAPEPEPTSGPIAGSCRSLSEREVDILRCLTDGASNKLIARRFQIAESTVKIHVKGILRKINVRNRTQAAIWALSQTSSFAGAAKPGTMRPGGELLAKAELRP